MEEFALIKSRVNLNRVNLGIALISDHGAVSITVSSSNQKVKHKIFTLFVIEITPIHG